MSFCVKCGQKLEDDALFCPGCGQAVSEPENKGKSSAQQKVEDAFNQFNSTPDTTHDYDPNDIKNNKAMAILAYFGLLVLIPLFAAKESKFARFHTNQGLVLFIAYIIFKIVAEVALGILFWTILPVYKIAELLFDLIGILFIVLVIIGIVNAGSGKAKELPILGKLRILK